MNPDSETDSITDINEVPSIDPIDPPGEDATPSVEDRLAYVEEILKIN